MGKLKQKLDSAEKASTTFEAILNEPYSLIIRDAAIQRFEYTFEITWKTLQAYLNEQEGIVANSPKSVFREALSVGLLNPEQTELALQMTDDRNLTTHTYHEEVAERIFKKLSKYYGLVSELLQAIKNGI